MHNRTSGNVLFLILIAVALFAALSYVVSGSTRSGGGSISKEKAALLAAQVLQYPATIKTGILRMVVNDGADVDVISDVGMLWHPGMSGMPDHDDPALFDYQKHLIFHPKGGAVAYQEIAPDILDQFSPPLPPEYNNWTFPTGSIDITIPNVGSSEPEKTILLLGIKPEICQAVNEKMGVLYSIDGSGDHSCDISGKAAPNEGDSGCANVFAGHPSIVEITVSTQEREYTCWSTQLWRDKTYLPLSRPKHG